MTAALSVQYVLHFFKVNNWVWQWPYAFQQVTWFRFPQCLNILHTDLQTLDPEQPHFRWHEIHRDSTWLRKVSHLIQHFSLVLQWLKHLPGHAYSANVALCDTLSGLLTSYTSRYLFPPPVSHRFSSALAHRFYRESLNFGHRHLNLLYLK